MKTKTKTKKKKQSSFTAGGRGKRRIARGKRPWDGARADEEDLLELDEEDEFTRDDADLIDDADEEEEVEEPIEDLAETLDADTYDRAGKEETLSEEPEEESDPEEELSPEEVRDFTREFARVPDDIPDLGEEDPEPEEYDAYEDSEEEREDPDGSGAPPAASGSRSSAGGEAPRRTRKKRRRGSEPRSASLSLPERLRESALRLTPFEWAAVGMSVLLVVAAISLGLMFGRVQAQKRQMEAFREIGAELAGVRIIGQSGLIAMREAASLRLEQETMEEVLEEPEEETWEPEEVPVAIPVQMSLTSIKSDIKIKFTNLDTGKLVPDMDFTVSVKMPDGKEDVWNDHDHDGIIYKTGVAAGSWSVTPRELAGEAADRYTLDTATKKVTVKEQIEYKKVEVADEIKKESQVNVAAEDTEPQEAMAVESVNVDTVEWVESSQEEVDAEDGGFTWKEVDKADIAEPAASARLTGSGASWRELGVVRAAVPVPAQAGESAQVRMPAARGSLADRSAGFLASLWNGLALRAAAAEAETGTGTEAGTEKKLSLGQTELHLEVGSSESLLVTCHGFEDPVYVWSSADEGIAQVSGGLVTGVSAGTTKITVRVEGDEEHKAECTVTVNGERIPVIEENKEEETIKDEAEPVLEEDPEKKLVLSATTLKLLVGGKKKLSVKTQGLEDKSVEWSSSDKEVATVSEEGEVKGVKAGKATITVISLEDEELKALCEVTVTEGGVLKTKNGDTVYVKDGDSYREATAADYGGDATFYCKVSNKRIIYHGWQNLDGYTYFYDKEGKAVTGDQVILGVQYHFSDAGVLATGSGTLGVDVSKWNGSVDWNAVKKSGVDYAIIRCGFRGTATGVLVEDSKFHTNIRGALNAGLKVGVYFFSAAINDVEAVEEASMAAALCSGYKLTYPVFLDVERSDSGSGRADRISTADRTAVIKAFCATIANSGYRAGLYANKNWMEEMIDTPSLTGYKLWLAQYSAEPTYTRTRYDIWQYTSKGAIGGISGKVDLNISYLSY